MTIVSKYRKASGPRIAKGSKHPILKGLDGEWPMLLGANEVVVKPGKDVEVLGESSRR